MQADGRWGFNSAFKELKQIFTGSFPEPDVLPSLLRSSKQSLSFISNRNPLWHLCTLSCLLHAMCISFSLIWWLLLRFGAEYKLWRSLIIYCPTASLSSLFLHTLFLTTVSFSVWDNKFHLQHVKVTVLCTVIFVFLDSQQEGESMYILLWRIYRMSQKECARLRESVHYVKVYRYNSKHIYPKLNGYWDNGQRKVWSSCGSTYCTC
jgi:hypothetical protein